MNINIYENYAVDIEKHFGWIDEENSLPDDISFTNDNVSDNRIINGGELLEIFGKHFSEDWLQSVEWKENFIGFEYFNPMNGEGWEYKYRISEMK